MVITSLSRGRGISSGGVTKVFLPVVGDAAIVRVFIIPGTKVHLGQLACATSSSSV